MDITDDPLQTTRDLLDRTATVRHGFLDVLGESVAPDVPTVAQRAMNSVLVAGVYERLWRPVAFYIASGVTTGAEQRRAADALRLSGAHRLLDVACGPGYLAAAAMGRGATAQGLDFSAEMVAVARTAYPDLVVTEGDTEELPYGDGTFDAVVSSFGVHHIPRPDVALAECRRVLKPGARIAFTVWASPEENIAWSLVFDAIDRHGDRSAAKSPPPGGTLNQIAHCVRLLEAAGFAESSAQIVRAEWLVPDAQALISALSAGTVRMAALIAAIFVAGLVLLPRQLPQQPFYPSRSRL